MITIEIKDAEKIGEGLSEVEIFCDFDGIKELKRQIEFLENGQSHVHLATPSWAGTELDEIPSGDGNVIVNQVTIIRVTG